MKKFIRFCAGLVCMAVAVVSGSALVLSRVLPDHYYVAAGETLSIEGPLPVKATGLATQLPARVSASAGTSYRTTLRLFGTVAVKDVSVQVVDREMVIPGGNPFGIKMFTEGVMVVGFSDVDVNGRFQNPAKTAGIKIGDVITSIDGRTVASNEEVGRVVADGKGKSLEFAVTRGEERFTLTVQPVLSESGYRAGIWVRDSSAGIGTMTYYNPSTGVFAGLGHAICDVDTGEIMPLSRGEVVDVTISGVNKGHTGSPGELKGSFRNDRLLGTLLYNGETGVFGRLRTQPYDGVPVPLALKQEVKPGPAQIYTTLVGSRPEAYDIVIEKVNTGDQNTTKNMVIRITDERLLEKTGGIVQGMSGSPILQNGKLVGAVTHVFVNDFRRGYGIFAENMANTAENVAGGLLLAS